MTGFSGSCSTWKGLGSRSRVKHPHYSLSNKSDSIFHTRKFENLFDRWNLEIKFLLWQDKFPKSSWPNDIHHPPLLFQYVLWGLKGCHATAHVPRPPNTTTNRKQIWKSWDTTPILEVSGGYRYISCNPVRSINNISGWRLGDIAQPSERSYYRTFLAFTSWTPGTWQGTNWHQQYRQPPDIFQGMAESASKAAQPWRELSV